MSDASKPREKQQWPLEKPKHNMARELRGIHVIDPADEEFKVIMKNARRKLKFRCQQQCLARADAKSTCKPAACRIIARQNAHASLKPTSLRESVGKELFIEVMKIMLQGVELFH